MPIKRVLLVEMLGDVNASTYKILSRERFVQTRSRFGGAGVGAAAAGTGATR
jgi:hypothetical protein